jgi:hypothetical protein
MNENGSSNGRLKVVVGVDGSAGSLEALRSPLEEARLRNHASAALCDIDDVEVEHDLLVVGSRGHAVKEQLWTSA